jgi:hypothetical protein
MKLCLFITAIFVENLFGKCSHERLDSFFRFCREFIKTPVEEQECKDELQSGVQGNSRCGLLNIVSISGHHVYLFIYDTNQELTELINSKHYTAENNIFQSRKI